MTTDIRLQDENKLLRARLKAAVDGLELLLKSFPCRDAAIEAHANALVQGERELMKEWR